jgi:hypothetical protein
VLRSDGFLFHSRSIGILFCSLEFKFLHEEFCDTFLLCSGALLALNSKSRVSFFTDTSIFC